MVFTGVSSKDISVINFFSVILLKDETLSFGVFIAQPVNSTKERIEINVIICL